MPRDINGGQGPPENESAPGQGRPRDFGNGNGAVYSDFKTELQTIDLADVHFDRACERLHRLGPRAVGEFLAELGAAYLIRTPIETQLERYTARLDRDTIRAVGGHKFASAPLHLCNAAERSAP
jgi:hypothetical protein